MFTHLGKKYYTQIDCAKELVSEGMSVMDAARSSDLTYQTVYVNTIAIRNKRKKATEKKFNIHLATKAHTIVKNYLDVAEDYGLKDFNNIGEKMADEEMLQKYIEKIVDYAKKKIDAMPLKDLV